jgi:hypothetical protein
MRLPFDTAAFLGTFAAFNRATWPVLLALWIASAAAAWWLAAGRARGPWLAALLGVHWLWSGIAYHLWAFTRINPAAAWFSVAFVLEGLLLVMAGRRGRLRFGWDASLRHLAGLALLALSLAYPMLTIASGLRPPAAPMFGVPCPTVLFTAGVLLMADLPVPRALLIIPAAWSLVGGSAALLLGMTPDLLLFGALAALLPLMLPREALDAIDRWLAPPAVCNAPLPGDNVAARPTYQMTLARLAAARPEHVWPWLLQLGNGRGGLYSYDWLDRLFGYLDGPSATTVLSDYQHLQPGDVVPVGRGGGFPVARVEPYRSLLLAGTDQQVRWSWEIALQPVDAGHTRIVSRSRGEVPRTLATRVFMALLGPAAFLMTRRMLAGLALRAERLGEREPVRPAV